MILKKIQKTKIGLIVLVLAIFQLLLLINLPLANSYLIHQTDSPTNTQTIIKNDKKFNGLSFGEIFSFNFLPMISAQEDPVLYCCQETNEGALCQDILSTTASATDPQSCANPIPVKCDLVAGCQRGCCYDPQEGLCSEGAPKQICENGGGVWDNDDSCLLASCQKGCCVLDDNAQFTTEQHCENLAEFAGTQKDFRDIPSEPACLALVASFDEGACVLEGGTCRFATERACLLDMQGDFYAGYLCSAEEIQNLDVDCEKQVDVGCVNGEDEIYWFDSCGNRENIYSSDKDTSWNSGRILAKEDSCNPTDGNIESRTCGNCYAPLSSKCSEIESGLHINDGDFVCKDLRCDDGTRMYDNGESWCIYDGSIGERDSPFGEGQFASDTVGSEHWKAYCHEGDIEIDRCGEYRTKVCAQSVIEEGSQTFSTASCIVNDATACLNYNPEIDEDMDEDEIEREMEKMKEACNDNTHCMIKSVNIDTYFEFDMCISRYPKGSDLSSGIDENLCEDLTKSLECIGREERVTYDWGFEWAWKQNENCEKQEFVEQLNDLCISLGDCGSYINYMGEGSDNIAAKKSRETVTWGLDGKSEGFSNLKHDGLEGFSWTEYVSFKDIVLGRYVLLQEIDDFSQSISGENTEGAFENRDEIGLYNWLVGVPGASGILIFGLKKIAPRWFMTLASSRTLPFGSGFDAGTFTHNIPASPNTFGKLVAGAQAILTILAVAAIGAWVGAKIAEAAGREGEGAEAAAWSGGLGGAGAAMVFLLSTSWNPLGWGLIAAAVISGLFEWLSGWGVPRESTFDFQCLPWQAPTFTSDADAQTNCEKCNADPLKPCTQYRCEALGQSCKLLNEELNDENPTCESLQYEPRPPVISSGIVLDENHEFENPLTEGVDLKSLSRTDGCIQEFTSVKFTLETDETAQCKYDFVGTSITYDDKESNYPQELNAFTKNHTFEINMPSIDSASLYDVGGDIIESYADGKMYVRCQDFWENFNLNEYVVNFCVHSGPDETAVWHDLTKTDPKTGDWLSYGTTQQTMKMWTNKPADCKYDKAPGKPYDLMKNNMTCNTALTQKQLFGWPCSTTLTNLTAGENKFYFKCQDQPGRPANESDLRNTNQDDFEYTLHVTRDQLSITSVSPVGEVIGGFEPFSVNLGARTSGGAEGGEAACYYSWANNWVLFFETFASGHRQEGLTLMGGDFNIPIKCEDNADNNATSNITFNLNIDSAVPNLVRAYHDGGYLKLITDEDAMCYYNTEQCNPFDKQTSILMTIGLSKIHTVAWDPQQTYYVKCEDVWGNLNPDCMTIRPSSIV